MNELLRLIHKYQTESINVSAALQVENDLRYQQKFTRCLKQNAAILRDLYEMAANAADVEVFA